MNARRDTQKETLGIGASGVTPSTCLRRILLLSILALTAACGAQKDRRLPGGPWDVEAQDRADERGVADGVLSFDRSRISVPASYSSCLQMSPPLQFVSCGPAYAEVSDRPRRTIDLAQRFSTKAQLTEVGLWPIRPDEVLDQDFREFARWYVKPPVIAPKRLELSRVAQEALPPGPTPASASPFAVSSARFSLWRSISRKAACSA